MSKWIDVGAPSEIPDQEYKLIEVDHTPIAVFNLKGEFCAIQDNCPHQHMPIADGLVEDCTITCPYHHAKFDLKTGAVLEPPAVDDLITYETRLVDGKIQIKIE